MSANSRSILPEDMDFLGPGISQLALVPVLCTFQLQRDDRMLQTLHSRGGGRLGASVGGGIRKLVVSGPILHPDSGSIPPIGELVEMSSGSVSPSSRTCMVKTCKAGSAPAGHQECPRHSPCYVEGKYVPEECRPCGAILDELRGLPIDRVRESLAWSILMEHLRSLSSMAREDSPQGALEVPGDVAAWFSDGSSIRVDPPPRPGGRVGLLQGDSTNSIDGLASRMQYFENSVATIREQLRDLISSVPPLSSRDGPSTSQDVPSDSPRAKRPRLASGVASGSRDSFSSPLVDPGYGDVDDSDGFDASEYDETSEWDQPTPSERLGWRRKHDNWVVREDEGVLMGYVKIEDGTFQPLVNLEFRKQIVRGRVSFFYRSRVPQSDSWSSPKELVRRLSYALPNLAARVEGSPAPKPSLVANKGGRFGLELLVGDPSSPPLVSWSDLPALWAIRASGDKTGPRAAEDQLRAARPLRLDWAPGTAEQATVAFLRGDSSSTGPPPASLQKPSPAVSAADKEARDQGLRLFSVLSCLELVSSFLDAAVVLRQEWSQEDFRSFISTAAEAVRGSAAMLAPLVKDKVQGAVSKRVAFREAAVPKALSSVKLDLVNLEPLSPLPYGSLEGIAAILRSRPPPAQLVLKGSLEDLLVRQSRSYQGSGSRGRSSSGRRGRGGKGNGGSEKDSSRRHDSARDSPRSSSPPRGSFRGAGRGRGRQGGSGSTNRSAGKGSSTQSQN